MGRTLARGTAAGQARNAVLPLDLRGTVIPNRVTRAPHPHPAAVAAAVERKGEQRGYQDRVLPASFEEHHGRRPRHGARRLRAPRARARGPAVPAGHQGRRVPHGLRPHGHGRRLLQGRAQAQADPARQRRLRPARHRGGPPGGRARRQQRRGELGGRGRAHDHADALRPQAHRLDAQQRGGGEVAGRRHRRAARLRAGRQDAGHRRASAPSARRSSAAPRASTSRSSTTTSPGSPRTRRTRSASASRCCPSSCARRMW